MSHTRKQESGRSQLPYSQSLRVNAEAPLQNHFANPTSTNRTGALLGGSAGFGLPQTNSSRVRNFVNGSHQNSTQAHNLHDDASTANSLFHNSLQQHMMNNPEVLGEAANEGQIAAPAKLSVACNSQIKLGASIGGSKRQASTKENNNGTLRGGSGFIQNMNYKKGMVASSSQIQKASYKSQTLSNRNTANSTTRMLGSNVGTRDGPGGAGTNSTLNNSTMHQQMQHQKSSGNLDHTLSKQHKQQHNSSTSIGKVTTMRHNMNRKQNIYNSNNQKIAEPMLSSRNNNAPALNHFAGSINNTSGQAILSELPVPTNLQKSGEMPHCKVDRQNSFVLHGKRSGTAAAFSQKIATQQQLNLHIGNGLKVKAVDGQQHLSAAPVDVFNAQAPNETQIMKARPGTSVRLAAQRAGNILLGFNQPGLRGNNIQVKQRQQSSSSGGTLIKTQHDGRQNSSTGGPHGKIQAAENSATVGGVTTKLFADKENNCGATHSMNVKKLGYRSKHANTIENPVSQKLDAPEHQMTDESEVDGSFSGPATTLSQVIDTSEQCDLGTNTLASTAHVSANQMIDTNQMFSQFSLDHPTQYLSREMTTEIERQNINMSTEYGCSIMEYIREQEKGNLTENCLLRHRITPALRARMIDWMIEVLTNFKCDCQTFFLAVSLLDRYFKSKQETLEVASLHIIGVTAMFIASKYEDIYPLKMKMVHEKIAHTKLAIMDIKSLELDILKAINYKIPAPTVLDFLRVYLQEVLGIGHVGKTSLTDEEKEKVPTTSNTVEGLNHLIFKMAMYLAKMAMHDYELSGKKPSIVGIGALYVALKICEQLKRDTLITNSIVQRLVKAANSEEDEIIEVSQKVLFLAQNFDKTFPGLENLKKTHFVSITQLL